MRIKDQEIEHAHQKSLPAQDQNPIVQSKEDKRKDQ
jgi:hypothetical protein